MNDLHCICRGEDDPSDFDVMMQRRKEAMSRARKRRQKVSGIACTVYWEIS